MSRVPGSNNTQVFFFVNSGLQLYCKTVVLSVALCVFLFSVCFRCLRFTFYCLLFVYRVGYPAVHCLFFSFPFRTQFATPKCLRAQSPSFLFEPNGEDKHAFKTVFLK